MEILMESFSGRKSQSIAVFTLKSNNEKICQLFMQTGMPAMLS
jgi:hypothetical protein